MISDDSFAWMVAEEVKNKLSPRERQILLQPENWGKWQRCLVALVDNLDDQIARIEEDEEADSRRFASIGSRRLQNEAESAYRGRKQKIERFKFYVNKRLDQVTAMIENGSTPEMSGAQEVEFLRRAINQHRKMLVDNDMEDTPIDRALWAALDGRWEFDNLDLSTI
jgi:hypothetical protein